MKPYHYYQTNSADSVGTQSSGVVIENPNLITRWWGSDLSLLTALGDRFLSVGFSFLNRKNSRSENFGCFCYQSLFQEFF